MRSQRRRGWSSAVAGASLVVGACMAVQARGDDAGATDREKQLAQKVDEMQKQIDELTKRVSDGSSRAGDELAARVDELEKLTKKDKDGLFGYWANGVRMDSANGAFRLKIGGRIQSDWAFFQHNNGAEAAGGEQVEAGEEFRRARLYMGGQIYNNVEFMDEWDFAGGTPTARDVWIAVKNLPFTAQVGNMKEPTGTEELTSDLFIPFMERSSGNEAFSPDYKAGAMLSDNFCGDNGVWQAGVFRNSGASGNDTGNARSGDYNYTARVAGRPWAEDGQFMTAGLSASLRSPAGGMTEFSAHPEMHIAPKFVDTGAFPCDRERMLEVDAGFVSGPFWAYADWFHVQALAAGEPNVTFNAWSLAGGYFITGESKPYQASNASYGRITPKRNFDGNGGMGAWEVNARIDSLDLNDKDVSGGKIENWTVGVSWWLNPNTRFMVDYVHTIQRTVAVWVNGLEMRFQIDF